METKEEAQKIILKQITSDDPEVRAEFLKLFKNEVPLFSEYMAETTLNWRKLDDNINANDELAYVSALVYSVLTLHVASTKLFLSGHLVAAGNLFRQVIEAIALSLLCSKKETGILDQFMNNLYSTQKAVDHALGQSDILVSNKDALETLKRSQKFYHLYSHISFMTISSITSFSDKNLYVGLILTKEK